MNQKNKTAIQCLNVLMNRYPTSNSLAVIFFVVLLLSLSHVYLHLLLSFLSLILTAPRLLFLDFTAPATTKVMDIQIYNLLAGQLLRRSLPISSQCSHCLLDVF